MMSGSRSLREKITLFILFIIALPFTLGLFVLFVIIFSLISPFEFPFYKKSNYKKDLNKKYYLFITKSRKYKLYNDFVKKGKEELININDEELRVIVLDNKKLSYQYFETKDNNVYYVLKINDIEESFYLENKKSDKFIFY